MAVSKDLIANIIIGTITILIGIGTIWVVRWQTYVLLDCQPDDEERLIRILERQPTAASGGSSVVELQLSETPVLPDGIKVQPPGSCVDRATTECALTAEQANQI